MSLALGLWMYLVVLEWPGCVIVEIWQPPKRVWPHWCHFPPLLPSRYSLSCLLPAESHLHRAQDIKDLSVCTSRLTNLSMSIRRLTCWFHNEVNSYSQNTFIILLTSSLTRGPQALTVTWVSETLHWLLVKRAHICISTAPS